MRYATFLFGTFALLFSATDGLAQEPPAQAQASLAAAFRDAQHLADCVMALDAKCAATLYDAKSYELLNPPTFNPNNDLARYFDTLRRRGIKFTLFQTRPAHELFEDGGARVYAFVPYTRSVEIDDRISGTNWFFIALSADGGATWKFVDAEGLTPEQIRKIIPSYADQPLPLMRWVDGRK